MSREREIAKHLRELAAKKQFETFVCEVTEVTGATCTVKRLLDEKVVRDVRLNATVKEKDGLLIVPQKGSIVLITSIDGWYFFVSQYSEIEKIMLHAKDTIELNGGENGGIVKSKSVAEKLNELEKQTNNILTALKGITIATPSGPMPFAPIFAAINNLPITDKSSLENTNIKH